MNDFMAGHTRRRLLARLRILALGGAVLPFSGDQPRRNTETSLLLACVTFADLKGTKLRFFHGQDRIEDDDEREDRIAPLLAAQVAQLDLICRSPAATAAGLRAKAATWQLWDSGELVHRAARHGLIEDRLLVSMFQDLEAVA